MHYENLNSKRRYQLKFSSKLPDFIVLKKCDRKEFLFKSVWGVNGEGRGDKNQLMLSFPAQWINCQTTDELNI